VAAEAASWNESKNAKKRDEMWMKLTTITTTTTTTATVASASSMEVVVIGFFTHTFST